MSDLVDIVKKIVKIGFFTCHKQTTSRTAEPIRKIRATVTKELIEKWFSEHYLKSN
jgi:hypothetical protein